MTKRTERETNLPLEKLPQSSSVIRFMGIVRVGMRFSEAQQFFGIKGNEPQEQLMRWRISLAKPDGENNLSRAKFLVTFPDLENETKRELLSLWEQYESGNISEEDKGLALFCIFARWRSLKDRKDFPNFENVLPKVA